MIPKLFLSVVAVLAVLLNTSLADVTFEDLFHMTPTAAERALGAQRLKMLQAAADDFNAVLNFKQPVHAQIDKKAPLPADGGTTFYKCAGHDLTVMKSLFSMGELHGYMYGPVLKLKSKIGDGNSCTISRISFYSIETLNLLMKP